MFDHAVIRGGSGASAAFATLGGFGEESLVEARGVVRGEVGGEEEVGWVEGEGEGCYMFHH